MPELVDSGGVGPWEENKRRRIEHKCWTLTYIYVNSTPSLRLIIFNFEQCNTKNVRLAKIYYLKIT